MNALIQFLAKSGLLTKDFDHHLLRASMVLIFLAFWFAYEAQVLIPHISNGPLIFWMCPVFGIRGASWFLGVSEWLFGTLLFLGFWNKRLGILGAIGSSITFLMTVTIIPFMPNGWDSLPDFRRWPAMPFLMKDVVLLAASIYLLKHDVVRLLEAGRSTSVALSQTEKDYFGRYQLLGHIFIGCEYYAASIGRSAMARLLAFFAAQKMGRRTRTKPLSCGRIAFLQAQVAFSEKIRQCAVAGPSAIREANGVDCSLSRPNCLPHDFWLVAARC